ncbi:MAG: hypothetical protein MI810_05785 [Flavobacteriales bacterium]|nr:hypothetical protein [Flavobacteriales bacterium]
MKLLFKRITLRFFLATFMIAVSIMNFAQPPGGPPPGGGGPAGDPPCWDPPCVPIDGGLGFLIAAGTFLGIRKIYGMYK